MIRKTLACALLAAAACGGAPKRHAMTPEEMLAADPLPLAKGAKWTYDVTVKRFDPDAGKEVSKTLEWTTEVVDAREGNGVTAFRVKGWPTDLALDPADQAPVATERTVLRS